MPEVTQEKLNAFIGKMLGDLGGVFSLPITRIGFRLGLFYALHRHGPATSLELAARTLNGLRERYVREWATAQAANVMSRGFTRIRRATQGPFNTVIEALP